jgi:uncharacterized membrane protein (UPF0127 family)
MTGALVDNEASATRTNAIKDETHEPDRPGEDLKFVRAVNASKGSTVATRVRWAATSESRRRGLLGRSTFEPTEGLYIVPTQWIHMFGMRFPIDVAFLAADGRVLFIHHELKPNRFSRVVWRADGALELAAATLRATQTEVGDIIEFQPLPLQ